MKKENYYFAKQVAKCGIYAIANIIDMRIYIGQAQSLNSRCDSHYYDLIRGADNARLQEDYNAGKELVFFTLEAGGWYSNTIKRDLNFLESMYCYIAIQEGLKEDESLYNANKNETIRCGGEDYFKKKFKREHKSGKNFREKRAQIMKQFDTVFRDHFGKTAGELLELSREDREKIWDKYKDNHNKLHNGMFNSNDKYGEYSLGLISISDQNDKVPVIPSLDRIIFTKIGEYLDQSMLEILEEKLQDIHENGYCFWALNKMNTETVRYFCSHNDKDDEWHDQDIYVIMKYTDSPSEIKKRCDQAKILDCHSASDTEGITTSDRVYGGDIREMELEGFKPVESLRLEKTDCADMQFPATLRHRETCKKDGRCPDYGRAFVVEKLYILKENFPEEDLLQFYDVCNSGYYKKGKSDELKRAVGSIRGQNDTACLRLNSQFKSDDVRKKLGGQMVRRDEESYEGNYIVAKLKNPYFVKLRLDNEQKKRNKFEE